MTSMFSKHYHKVAFSIFLVLGAADVAQAMYQQGWDLNDPRHAAYVAGYHAAQQAMQQQAAQAQASTSRPTGLLDVPVRSSLDVAVIPARHVASSSHQPMGLLDVPVRSSLDEVILPLQPRRSARTRTPSPDERAGPSARRGSPRRASPHRASHRTWEQTRAEFRASLAERRAKPHLPPRTDIAPAHQKSTAAPYVPRRLLIISDEQADKEIRALARQVLPDLEKIAKKVQAGKLEKKRSSRREEASSSNAPVASTSQAAQAPDFTGLHARQELCRAGYNILYFLTSDHAHALKHVRKVAKGAPFGPEWDFAKSERAFGKAFSKLPQKLQDRFSKIWAGVEQELAETNSKPSALFPLRGARDAAKYRAIRKSFEKVGFRSAAKSIIPDELPTQDKKIAGLNRSLERLYRYGLKPSEKKKFQTEFQERLLKLKS